MLLIYSQQLSPRFLYTLKVAFEIVIKAPYKVITDRQEFLQYNGPKINYSDEGISAELQINPTGLLFENKVYQQDVKVDSAGDLTTIFRSGFADAFSFDIFSAVFFMISRYEEYLHFQPDQHNRFSADQSIAVKSGFHQIPIVHHWIERLTATIQKRYPAFVYSTPQYEFVPTFDVDNAFAYLHKSPLRTIAGIAGALIRDHDDLKKRMKVLRGLERDPYDNVAYIEKVSRQFKLRPKFFILTAEYARYDKNISPFNPAFKSLIAEISCFADIGLHPSYQSAKKMKFPVNEKLRLSQCLGNKITKSRQHFLKISLPDTYIQLEKNGITDDFSMGYAEVAGFRAGIARPYPFYDLRNERETKLIVHPFFFMESTYRYYKKQKIDLIKKELGEIIERVKAVGGIFYPIWHNESLGEYKSWKGWRDVFVWMHEKAIPDD